MSSHIAKTDKESKWESKFIYILKPLNLKGLKSSSTTKNIQCSVVVAAAKAAGVIVVGNVPMTHIEHMWK